MHHQRVLKKKQLFISKDYCSKIFGKLDTKRSKIARTWFPAARELKRPRVQMCKQLNHKRNIYILLILLKQQYIPFCPVLFLFLAAGRPLNPQLGRRHRHLETREYLSRDVTHVRYQIRLVTRHCKIIRWTSKTSMPDQVR